MTDPPRRPRLASHVLPRRHRQGGARVVVLHDIQKNETVRVQERAWVLLSGMDGTRDVAGLVAYARASGAGAEEDEVSQFVRDLADAEMILDGVDLTPPTVPAPDPPPRPLDPLPGFRLSCDGRGICCRFYPSVVFSQLEAARARARLPLVEDGGMEQRRVFSPLVATDERVLAVALTDGRCAFLEEDLRCGVHRASGAGDKPLGCRVYPARFVDDGAAVRVSPWPECPCVFRSGVAPAAEGEPLTSCSRSDDLDAALYVERLPEEVPIASGSTAETRAYADLSRELAAIETKDAARSLLSLARALEAHGLPGARAALESPGPVVWADVSPWLAALAPRVARFALEDWRSPEDLPHRVAHVLEQACLLLAELPDDLLVGPGRYQAHEAFYLRTLLYGHQLVDRTGRRSVATLCRDRALRVLLARAAGVVAELAELTDPAFEVPLALVDASMRAYGLGGYLADLPEGAER